LSWVIIVIIIINFKNLTCVRGNIGGTMWISIFLLIKIWGFLSIYCNIMVMVACHTHHVITCGKFVILIEGPTFWEI